MGWRAQAAALAGLTLTAWIAARFPRALFSEVGDAPHPRRAEWGLAAGLLAGGLVLFEVFPAGDPLARALTAGLTMIACAVIYADLKFLIIPDLYSVAVAAGALALNLMRPAIRGPQGWIKILIGAALCGGFLAVVAWVWKRRTKVEGLGLGDVKLAAAFGALLGPQTGVWAITVSAAGGAILGFILQARKTDADAPVLFPYGAPLALAGAGFLLWERWS